VRSEKRERPSKSGPELASPWTKTRVELYLVSEVEEVGKCPDQTSASENAACFSYFLSQRKAELGILTIEKVTVFRNDGTSNVDPDMVFHVTVVSNAQAASDNVQGKAILPNGTRIGRNVMGET
jgi:hypothetical protein